MITSRLIALAVLLLVALVARNQVNLQEIGSNCLSTWDDAWDRKSGDEHVEHDESSVVRQLTFVRHGQFDDKVNDDAQRILTNLGEAQAAFTGKRLRMEHEAQPFTHFFHSTMTRAVQTATIIASQIGINKTSMLPLDSIREGNPSIDEDQPGFRIEEAFRSIFHRASTDQAEDSRELYVCHANVIRYFALRALQLPANAWTRLSLAHSSITEMKILSNGRVILQRLGDSAHIPVAQVSYVCC